MKKSDLTLGMKVMRDYKESWAYFVHKIDKRKNKVLVSSDERNEKGKFKSKEDTNTYWVEPNEVITEAEWNAKYLAIVYLHGLDSAPDRTKINIIKKAHPEVTTVIAPQIDYRTEGDTIFMKMVRELDNYKVVKIYGSSMGGFLAYYLAKHFGCDITVFNPALLNQSVPVAVSDQGVQPFNMNVVLGLKDDRFDWFDSAMWILDYEKFADVYINVDDFEHRVPVEIVEKYSVKLLDDQEAL